MTQETEPQFISVPVPSQYVTQVYAYIAELTGATAATPSVSTVPPVDPSDGDPLPVVEWTVEDFRRLMIEPLSSVQTIIRVLDLLAKQPDTRVSYTSLAQHLDMEKKSLQGNLSAFTRTVRRHYKRRNWPMTWVEALSSEPELKSEFFYTMNAAVAERWLKARAQG
ncbi:MULTISPECIES: hypothetical protein [unclassified Streptomyces]|uniref:Uncharacterized protein n=1 Tax=Streptomyces celluloflavus TaxID=58344 RepID=A0ABW7RDJ8_9ACTN|nr:MULTISPECIES: hypothetical protein [unclassified Streptomyces]MCX4395230.1 hypothetical protein [Streptomyces sp. NBC_01767]MCX4549357.1 hypothetical protein [Streptomyces sp. NBC_01500]